MKHLSTYAYIVVAAAFLSALQACKSKKLITKPIAAAETQDTAAPQERTQAAAVPAAVTVVRPDFRFTNLQFDFNSSVLSTDAIQRLDQITAEMKKDPTADFKLSGHASSEGSAAHNLALSVDRANSVKRYLVEAGIDAARLTTEGFGSTRPISSNQTEAGREQNRRVEVKHIQ